MTPPVYFLSLNIVNVRCFGPGQTLDLSDGNGRPRQWTILLGDNGVGKTTLLQCLAGLQVDEDATSSRRRMRSQNFRYRLMERGFVRGSSWDNSEPLKIAAVLCANVTIASGQVGDRVGTWEIDALPHHAEITYETGYGAGLLCFGYGASRRLGNTELTDIQIAVTCLSLFDDNATLINAEEWLLQADYAAKSLSGPDQERAGNRRDRIKQVLVDILPDVSDIRFAPTTTAPIRTTVQAKTPYGWVSIRAMSLGYRALMTWMVDFASRMFERYPESEDPLTEPAIVLVDEIDLHLHPRWQRTLMQFLSAIFPNTQFIVSAHSPLVVQAAVDANVVLLRRVGDHVIIDNDVHAIEGWRVDQILTSDMFGLESARPPQLDDVLRERTKILSKPRLSAKDKLRLQELEAQIGTLPTGETPTDIEAMDIIRRAAELLRKQALLPFNRFYQRSRGASFDQDY